MGRVVTGSEAWIRASEAPKRVQRDRSTVYRWVAAGRVRTWRPGRELLLNLPDLLLVENQTLRRVSGK